MTVMRGLGMAGLGREVSCVGVSRWTNRSRWWDRYVPVQISFLLTFKLLILKFPVTECTSRYNNSYVILFKLIVILDTNEITCLIGVLLTFLITMNDNQNPKQYLMYESKSSQSQENVYFRNLHKLATFHKRYNDLSSGLTLSRDWLTLSSHRTHSFIYSYSLVKQTFWFYFGC